VPVSVARQSEERDRGDPLYCEDDASAPVGERRSVPVDEREGMEPATGARLKRETRATVRYDMLSSESSKRSRAPARERPRSDRDIVL
jgi:hypothetical protein